MKRTTRNALCNLLLLAAGAALLLWVDRTFDRYVVQVLNLIAINTILALSLNLIYGFTGMFSLGHAGFMAVGAYVSSLLILPQAQKQTIYILKPLIWPFSVLQAPFFVAVLLGGLAAALFAILISVPVLRLGGDYLGIATLGFAEIIRVVANNIVPITNGALGLKGIPSYANLWWTYGWCALAVIFIARLVQSNTGNVLKAIRDDEVAAKAMGINVFKYKVISFTVGGFFAGIGGALLASLLTTIDPKMFTFMLTFNVLMIVVAGGLGSITGSVLSGAVITVLLEWLRFVENPVTIGGFTIPGVPGMRMVVFSLALLCIILFRREGIMGMREWSWDMLFRGRTRGGEAR
jgi:branched-chain amino acid transport system permease protein